MPRHTLHSEIWLVPLVEWRVISSDVIGWVLIIWLDAVVSESYLSTATARYFIDGILHNLFYHLKQ